MRFGTHSARALTRLLAASAVAATLGGGAALAQEGGSWRYDQYIQQERVKQQAIEAAERDRKSGDQRATIGTDEGRSSYSGSGLRSSPYYGRPQTRHADR